MQLDDGADIGFVDAHSEGDGRHDVLQLALLEFPLHRVPVLRIEPGMVGGGGKLRESSAASVSACLRVGGIHNGRTPRLVAQQVRDKPARREAGAISTTSMADVVAAESVDEPGGLFAFPIARRCRPAPRRGGGGECDDGGPGAEGRRKGVAQHAVVRAEVVAPLGDAVGLVDGDQAGFAPGQPGPWTCS